MSLTPFVSEYAAQPITIMNTADEAIPPRAIVEIIGVSMTFAGVKRLRVRKPTGFGSIGNHAFNGSVEIAAGDGKLGYGYMGMAWGTLNASSSPLENTFGPMPDSWELHSKSLGYAIAGEDSDGGYRLFMPSSVHIIEGTIYFGVSKGNTAQFTLSADGADDYTGEAVATYGDVDTDATCTVAKTGPNSWLMLHAECPE